MRFYATLPGRTEPSPLDVEHRENGRYWVTLNGVRHEVDAHTLEHGAVSLIVDGESFNVELDNGADLVTVWVRNQVTQLEVADERKMRLKAARAGFAAEGKQTILAPMPGKVVKVLVKLGQDVAEGQGLVVVEAMKMENELKSPRAGKVTGLWALEGTPVEQNAKLAQVE